MVGSVGVIATPGFGFGFDKVLERLGVERRRYVAGERKAELMDPFSPAEPEAVQRLLELQRELHDVFKDVVRERRGRALAAAETPEEVWADGEVFAGDHAVRIGLADDVGGMHATMRSFFGDGIEFRTYERRPPRLSDFIGASAAGGRTGASTTGGTAPVGRGAAGRGARLGSGPRARCFLRRISCDAVPACVCMRVASGTARTCCVPGWHISALGRCVGLAVGSVRIVMARHVRVMSAGSPASEHPGASKLCIRQ